MPRPDAVVDEVFDLFAALDADDEQLDFPILYGSGRDGWMNEKPEGPKDQGLAPLFDLILRHVPETQDGRRPVPDDRHHSRSQPRFSGVSSPAAFIPASSKPNQAIKVIDRDGTMLEQGRVSKILAFRGIERQPIEEGRAGDIVAIAGADQRHGGRHVLRA